MTEQSIQDEDKSIKQRVFDICSQLHAENNKVTIRLVLSMLPDVSSTSTIHKYHKLWKTELSSRQAELLSSHGLSKEFQNAFMQEITRFSSEAKLRYESHNQELIDEREAALEGLAAKETTNQTLTNKVEQLNAELSELKRELLLVVRDNTNSVNSLVERHEKEVINYSEQINALNLDVTKLEQLNESQRISVAKMELQVEAVPDLKETIGTLTIENKELTKAIETANVNLATRTEQVNSATAQVNLLEDQSARLTLELSTSKDKLLLTQAKNETLENDKVKLQSKVDNQLEKIEILTSDLNDKRELLKNMSKQEVEVK